VAAAKYLKRELFFSLNSAMGLQQYLQETYNLKGLQ